MDGLLKFATCLMLAVLLTVQLLLASPYRVKLTDDAINGRTLKTNETLIYKGTLTIDALGKYTPNSATVLINGDKYKTVDTFPLDLPVCDGDVVEVLFKSGVMPFYVYLASVKGQVTTDLQESSILMHSGVNRILKVAPILKSKG